MDKESLKRPHLEVEEDETLVETTFEPPTKLNKTEDEDEEPYIAESNGGGPPLSEPEPSDEIAGSEPVGETERADDDVNAVVGIGNAAAEERDEVGAPETGQGDMVSKVDGVNEEKHDSQPATTSATDSTAPTITPTSDPAAEHPDSDVPSFMLDTEGTEPPPSAVAAVDKASPPSSAAPTFAAPEPDSDAPTFILDSHGTALEPNETKNEDTASSSPAVPVAPTPAAAEAEITSGKPSHSVPSPLPKPVDPTIAPTFKNPDALVEERAEIPAPFVGRVIGKGGEMIRDLQARSGCRIDVDQNVPPGNPRIITYRGTRKTVDFAQRLVQILCSDHGKEAELPLGEARRKLLVVPASSVGKIIGRGGEMIRELQSRSQAKIQVDHTGANVLDPSTRQVTVTGTAEAVVKAEEMIMFLVANPTMDAMAAITMLVEDKNNGGVWGSGPPYPNMPNRGLGMQGQAGFGFDQVGYTPTPFGGGGYQQPAYNPYEGGPAGTEMEIFTAAKMYMGRIIGQKGVTINDLQKRSGCDIQINQDVPPGHDCQITIKGSRQGIESAKQMLREIIETGPSHPYAGGAPPQTGYGSGGGGGGGGGGYQQGGYIQPPVQSYPYHQPAPQPAFAQQQAYAPHFQAAPYGHQMSSYQAPPVQQYAMPPQPQYGGAYGHAPMAHMQAPPVTAWKVATAGDGQIYYYNEKTGETQWEKPLGMP